MLEARKIGVHISGQWLLKDISMCLNAGEILAVVGPNGSGKTTLLRALSRELEIDQGELMLDGVDLHRMDAARLAQRRAVLMQNTRLDFPFKVLDVVMMGRSPYNTGFHLDREIAQQVLRQLDVDDLQGRLYTTLSGGEKQRVQLARVLAQVWEDTEGYPRYLLLDEPTSALDLAHQQSLLQTLLLIRENRNISTLCILHDLNLAARYADRVLMLQHGQMIFIGAPEQGFTAERILQVFGLDVLVHADPHPSATGRPLIVAS